MRWGLFSTAAVFGATLSLFFGCQGQQPQVGSQTNWLRACDSTSECGELTCVCGTCTLACDSTDDCGDLDAGDAHSLFSVDYLDAIARVVPKDVAVDLQLGVEAPLELSVDLAGGSATYFVAPRRKVR